MNQIEGKRVAILATDGFEQVELTGPKEALEKAGAQVDIVSPQDGEIKGWDETDWGKSFPVDVTLDQSSAEDYNGARRTNQP